MSSNVGIVRCVVAELNPEKRFVTFILEFKYLTLQSRYRTRALLLLPLFANAGMLLGPLVGGLLSSQSGKGMSDVYPYAAPNIFAAAVYAVAALGVLLGLNETLEHFKHLEGSIFHRLWKRFTARSQAEQNYTVIDSDDEPDSPNPL